METGLLSGKTSSVYSANMLNFYIVKLSILWAIACNKPFDYLQMIIDMFCTFYLLCI